MTELCLLTVHAHPDDEASKGAPTVARYHTEGVRTVLVCCTGGEEGDILNPAMDTPEVRAELSKVRQEELEASAAIIGFDVVELLGFRDSGMPDTEANADPRAFANVDLDEAVGRLVAIIRRERPQVVLTYGDNQEGYPHPDHLRVHDITVPAFERAGDADWRPELGAAWQPQKLYYSVWSKMRAVAVHERMLELGLESPYDDKWFERPWQDDRITTTVDVRGYVHIRLDALLAHATQVDPKSPFWFGLPRHESEAIHPYEEFILARSLVDTELPEHDLFAGVRDAD